MRRISVLALVLLTGLVAARLPQAQAGSQHRFTTFDVPGAGTGAGQGTIVNVQYVRRPAGQTDNGIHSKQRASLRSTQQRRRM